MRGVAMAMVNSMRHTWQPGVSWLESSLASASPSVDALDTPQHRISESSQLQLRDEWHGIGLKLHQGPKEMAMPKDGECWGHQETQPRMHDF